MRTPSPQGNPKPEKKEGWINRIRRLLGPEPLAENDCLKINGIIGLLTLPGVCFFLAGDSSELPFPVEFGYVSLAAGIVLGGGYLAAFLRPALKRPVLVVQGAVICLLVVAYTAFMVHVARLMMAGTEKARMGHAPGILAVGAAYGIKQVVDFSGWSVDSGLARRLPAVFFVMGACCDGWVMYLMLQCFSAWKPS